MRVYFLFSGIHPENSAENSPEMYAFLLSVIQAQIRSDVPAGATTELLS